jgi:coenzyme F420-reducing hydrogenase delta subunit
MKTAIFFCQRLDPDQDTHRRSLERELGPDIRLFPLPCSGRIEALHLLKALETGAEKVYVIPCPEGTCRYGYGNTRARKRVDFARGLIGEIGIEPERIELVTVQGEVPQSIDTIVRRLPGMPQQRTALHRTPTTGQPVEPWIGRKDEGVKR